MVGLQIKKIYLLSCKWPKTYIECKMRDIIVVIKINANDKD